MKSFFFFFGLHFFFGQKNGHLRTCKPFFCNIFNNGSHLGCEVCLSAEDCGGCKLVLLKKSNLDYTRVNVTPKRVTSDGADLCGLAHEQHLRQAPKKRDDGGESLATQFSRPGIKILNPRPTVPIVMSQ